MTSSTRTYRTVLLFTLPFVLGAIVLSALRPRALRNQMHNQMQSALVQKDLSAIKLLIAQGANPNSSGNEIWLITPVEIAIKQGDNESLAFLLNHGAKATAWGLRSATKESPLTLAVRHRNVDAVKMLLSHGANESDLMEGNTFGFTIEGNPEYFFSPPRNADERKKQRIITELVERTATKSSKP